jgi:2,3-bisphosphoglycerate-independent phosphoglycerate mutase
MKKEQVGELATVIGRYYAMDRDKRWERIKIAIDGLVKGEGEDGTGQDCIVDVIKQNYEKDITDEFLKPINVNGKECRIKGGLSFKNECRFNCLLLPIFFQRWRHALLQL